MKATTETRRSMRAPLLLAAFLGLATSASGCIIDSDTPCDPRIDIPWALERGGFPVTCATAGAYTVEAFVTDRAYVVDCNAAQTLGTMSVPVLGVGSYNVVMSLLDINDNDLVPPTPPLQVNVPSACAVVTTPEAVFEIP